MENVAILKPNVSKEISNLFNLISNKSFDKYVYRFEFKKIITEEFLKTLKGTSKPYKKELFELIQNFDAYNSDNYINFDFMSAELFDFFLKDVSDFININYLKNVQSYKLERLANPPSEVYDYVGFSKLEIKPTGRDYGLLFE